MSLAVAETLAIGIILVSLMLAMVGANRRRMR